MKRGFYALIIALFMFSCSKEDVEPNAPVVGEKTQFVFTLADDGQAITRAVTGAGGTPPLSPTDITTYIQNVRLLVFDAGTDILVHDDFWSNTTDVYETWFPVVASALYDFVIITNTDITGSFTSPLLRGTSSNSTVMAMLKPFISKGIATGNGDFGTRYQMFPKTPDVNHMFYGITPDVKVVSNQKNIVTVNIKRIMAKINFTVDILNPTFQPAEASIPTFLTTTKLDVSRMPRALDMTMTQRLTSESGYVNCVVRSGAFTRVGTTGNKYQTTVFVLANNTNKAFLTLNLSTQNASNGSGIAINQPRLFWVDTNISIERNKIYNITSSVLAGNFGGDPNQPTTINPEDPDSKLGNLTVNVVASDWEAAPVSGSGIMH